MHPTFWKAFITIQNVETKIIGSKSENERSPNDLAVFVLGENDTGYKVFFLARIRQDEVLVRIY